MGKVVWDAEEAANATSGEMNSRWQAQSVSIDSRSVKPGDLFIAIKGERFDGHDFVAQSLAQGAVAAVVSRKPNEVPGNAPLLIVEDTFKALEALGIYARQRSKAKIIAVTGSVGKTSTKEMLKAAFGTQGKTYATTGNLNNHLGVPLSLARMPKDTEYGIFELGMNHAGEIAMLTQIAKPHIAIVTAVAPAHLEFFDSVEAIADAKAEIFAGIVQGGYAIINRDNPHYKRLVKHANEAGVTHILSFGFEEDATFRIVACTPDTGSSRITLRTPSQTFTYTLPLPGKHQAGNSAAVLAAVNAAGGDIEQAVRGFSSLSAPNGRGKEYMVKLDNGVCLLVDDSYNASPASVQAALALLEEKAKVLGGRAVAVLGDMLELGAASEDLHKALAKDIEARGVDIVFTAGKYMRVMQSVLPPAKQGGAFDASDVIGKELLRHIRPGDVILVKGSRGLRMEKVVQYIVDNGVVAQAPGVANAI